MTFLNELGSAMNQTTTENGAKTHLSSGNPLVDFFALAGASRGNSKMGLDLFLKAFAFDRLNAVRILFYLRDIRGGQGERQLFRNCLAYLAKNEKEVADKIVQHVPEYGRYDDLFGLQIETFLPLIEKQLEEDMKSDAPSLLAKWMPSENTSSKVTRSLARGMMRALGLSPKQYRKKLSALRAKITLVEQKMSAREFGAIEYDKIPSQASMKYRKAFFRNDTERYTAFLESVNKGEKKINTSTLYPYQVYEKVGTPGAEEMWKNLPDYTDDRNALVVADVSGSMTGRPMSVSVSLALYFAERNKGAFNGYFITFSGKPRLQKVVGTTLRDKMNSIERAEWGMNTDLYKVFEVILDTAVRNKTPESEMPSSLYVISDMEFDQATGHTDTNFQAIDMLYKTHGHTRPSLVFWNVDARQKQVAAGAHDKNVTLISGYSPSAFKLAFENKSPLDLIMDVVNSERYARINF